MFAVIDAECGHLSWTIQSKNEFINIFPAPMQFSLGAEDFAFCFLFTSTHMFFKPWTGFRAACFLLPLHCGKGHLEGNCSYIGHKGIGS